MERPVPFIHNMVCTAQIQISTPLQLDRLSQIFRFSSFNRRKFAAVTLRLVRPNCTILLFTSGKLVITGSKSASEALLSAFHVRRLLRRVCVGQVFRVINFQIQNVVAHAELDVREREILDIEALYERYHVYSTYQRCVVRSLAGGFCESSLMRPSCVCVLPRNVFPGLIFRWPSVAVVVLMFFSGKVSEHD
jgi:transcription initiation factor TFIID TATA-box-binding protein